MGLEQEFEKLKVLFKSAPVKGFLYPQLISRAGPVLHISHVNFSDELFHNAQIFNLKAFGVGKGLRDTTHDCGGEVGQTEYIFDRAAQKNASSICPPSVGGCIHEHPIIFLLPFLFSLQKEVY